MSERLCPSCKIALNPTPAKQFMQCSGCANVWRVPTPEDQQEGFALLQEFASWAAQELHHDVVAFPIGSLLKGEYLHGTSDVDVILVHAEEKILIPSSYYWNLFSEMSERFGKVKKKGRDICVIDMLLPVSNESAKNFQEQVHEAIRVQGTKIIRRGVWRKST